MENPRYHFLMNRWRVEAIEVLVSFGWLISPLIMFAAFQYVGLIPSFMPMWGRWLIYVTLFLMNVSIARSITSDKTDRPRN